MSEEHLHSFDVPTDFAGTLPRWLKGLAKLRGESPGFAMMQGGEVLYWRRRVLDSRFEAGRTTHFGIYRA